jgi:hypothetical protein
MKGPFQRNRKILRVAQIETTKIFLLEIDVIESTPNQLRQS